MNETKAEREARKGGENELAGSRSAQRALKPKQTRPQRKSKR